MSTLKSLPNEVSMVSKEIDDVDVSAGSADGAVDVEIAESLPATSIDGSVADEMEVGIAIIEALSFSG